MQSTIAVPVRFELKPAPQGTKTREPHCWNRKSIVASWLVLVKSETFLGADSNLTNENITC